MDCEPPFSYCEPLFSYCELWTVNRFEDCELFQKGIESESLLILLDKEGICASSGSACLADSDEPSHVIKAMKPGSSATRQMIRFSLGSSNGTRDVSQTMSGVAETVTSLRAAG